MMMMIEIELWKETWIMVFFSFIFFLINKMIWRKSLEFLQLIDKGMWVGSYF